MVEARAGGEGVPPRGGRSTYPTASLTVGSVYFVSSKGDTQTSWASRDNHLARLPLMRTAYHR
jgi:hypothetical protein